MYMVQLIYCTVSGGHTGSYLKCSNYCYSTWLIELLKLTCQEYKEEMQVLV